MRKLTRIAKTMQAILQTDANRLAQEVAFTQRQRVVTGSSFIVGLMTGWQAAPEVSLAGLSQAIGNAGTPISRQGLAQRFDEAAVQLCHSVLERSLEAMVTAMPVPDTLLARFPQVEVVDSSVISLPAPLADVWQGCGGFGERAKVAGVKLNVCWEMRRGALTHLDLSAARQHDQRSIAHRHPMAVGSLRIADLGYFNLADFAQMAADGSYFLTRYKRRTTVYVPASETPLDLQQWLPQQVGQQIACRVELGQQQRLACRLIAERVPLSVVRQRHDRLRDDARKKQQPISQQAWELAHWTIYLTNVPATRLATAEVFTLGRYRWQIELLFKLWKSDLGVDRWRSTQPERILCEIYIKLIGAIVTHWLLLVACWHQPHRSLRQAIWTIRGLAWQVANSLSQLPLLQHTLQVLCRALSRCRMDKSRQQPRAFQQIHCT